MRNISMHTKLFLTKDIESSITAYNIVRTRDIFNKKVTVMFIKAMLCYHYV